MHIRKYELELKCTAIRFVNSSNRRRQTNTLRNINEVRKERNETTYKCLLCENFLYVH